MDCYFWYLIYENKTNYEYDMKTVRAALTKLECKNKKPAICCKEGSLRPWEPKPSFCPLLDLDLDKRKKREISSGTFHLKIFCTVWKKLWFQIVICFRWYLYIFVCLWLSWFAWDDGHQVGPIKFFYLLQGAQGHS